MALTAAERQKRHRERTKAALARAAAGLTPEQIADRDAVMADPLWPTPTSNSHPQLPTFMGWSRYDWSAAPEALIDHFGMRAAWEVWRAEAQDVSDDEAARRGAESSAKASAIVDELRKLNPAADSA